MGKETPRLSSTPPAFQVQSPHPHHRSIAGSTTSTVVVEDADELD